MQCQRGPGRGGGEMGGRGLSWLAFSKISPVLQLLISQAKSEKGEGERSDHLQKKQKSASKK